MPLSANTPIMSIEIEEVEVLKRGKVFLFKNSANETVVIKSDVAHESTVKSVNPFVKKLDPASAVKILTAMERTQIEIFADEELRLLREQAVAGWDVKDDIQTMTDLKRAMDISFNAHQNVLKMEQRDMSELDSALLKRLEGDKSGLKGFTKLLNAPGGLEALGQIVAVDMFVGNTDRFRPEEDKLRVIQVGKRSFQFKSLSNLGNVVKINVGGNARVGGVDFFDSNSASMNMHLPLAKKAEAGVSLWTGRVLANGGERRAFAKAIVSDLEQVLSPKKSKWSLMSKLNVNAANRLEKGMVQGTRMIAAELKRKFSPNWPASGGAEERYKILMNV